MHKYIIATLDTRTPEQVEELRKQLAEFTGCEHTEVLVLPGVSEVVQVDCVHHHKNKTASDLPDESTGKSHKRGKGE